MATIKTQCQGCRVNIIMQTDGPISMSNGKINGRRMLCNPCWNAINFTGVDRGMSVISLNLKIKEGA